ncbi:phage tail assembly chaperone [Litorisediminicola beolgyonensis]|uniref:Uncharacterized protein n=1 Tax=Litorisediminicola beolgyonensis TaxID=1173614 RepID=A0ABW3ZE22_9RHOB
MPPEGSEPLWNAFLQLSRARSCGPAGPNALAFTEIDAWARLMRVPLEPHHVSALLEMDRVWMDRAYSKSAAPPGAKTLPQRSDHKLTAAMFDGDVARDAIP